MKKDWSRGRFPVEVVKDVVAKSELAKKLKAKMKGRLARVEPKRLRRWCIVALAGMLMGDVILLYQAGERRLAGVHFSTLSPAATIGERERRPVSRTFGLAWDSLMADPGMKRAWDSLVMVRPELKDTLARLQQADSAVPGR